MGLQQGSLSLCRYRLLGAGSRHSIAKLSGLLDPHKAPPLKIGGIHKEELVGWVRPVGLDGLELAPDAAWDLSDCLVDDGYVLRLRIERRRVPGQLLQLIYKQKFHAAESKAGKTPGPKERKDLRDEVKKDLTGRALPQVAHIDAYWRDRAGEVALFTTGKKTRELFEALFLQSFAGPLGQTLVRVDPPLMGLTRDQWEDSAVASETLGRISLTTPVAFAEQIYP